MEDLLVRGVGRRANAAAAGQVAEILDVGENDIGRLVVVRIPMVLSTALGSNVRRETCIDHDVLLARVLVDAESPDDEEAMAKVKFTRQPSKLVVQLGQGKRVLGDVCQG